MRTFHFETMEEGYPQLVTALQREGRARSPRGQKTYELRDAIIELRDPTRSHPPSSRRYSRKIAAAEAACLVGGVGDPGLMVRAGANFARFLDGGQLHGAYGPRVRGQLPLAIERLRDDPDTRQAIVTVWDSKYDQAGWTPRDLPCTLHFQFAIGSTGKLEMTTVMRSNDVWWGVAHDIPMFTCLQATVAHALRLDAGPYHHVAHSLHLYERDIEAAEAELGWIVRGEDPPHSGAEYASPGYMDGFDGEQQGDPVLNFEESAERARAIVEGRPILRPTRSEEWYQRQLEPIVGERPEFEPLR